MSLYNSLLSLTERNEAFYYKDYYVNYEDYRVFNYHLANYTDFLEPNALEARGITFYIPKEPRPPFCISRPWKKFFNLGECPFTMDLDLNTIKKTALKEDGSLISTYYNPLTGSFGVKSKQDFFSEQSQMATKLLKRNEFYNLKEDLIDLAMMGYTVIMELVSPANRIVIAYPKTELKVLGIRDTTSGELIEKDNSLLEMFDAVKDLWVDESFPVKEEFINSVSSQVDLEGYVFTLNSGLMVKIKTEWYKSLHHLKDSVSSPARLFEAIILETVDDVKSMFPDDEMQLEIISKMESEVVPKFNHLVKTVEEFYETNKLLDRKSYAIKGQEELGMLFNLAMMKYLNKFKENGYKEFAIKYKNKYFGINQIANLVEEKE